MKKTGTFFLAKDNLPLGIILGLISPIVGLLLFYNKSFSGASIGAYLDFVIHQNSLLTSLGSLCLLANVVLFTIYINTRRDKTATGIFGITLLFGMAILLLKVWN